MNHDYAHCANMTDECPKSCFRAQLTRDLKEGMVVSFMSMKNTDMCPLTKKDRVMEIVIKLTEEDFKKVQDGRAPVTVMRSAIRNGTPLPKGHGALKDADEVMKEMERNFDMQDLYLPIHFKQFALDEAQTIIEADKEDNNERLD